MLREEVVLEGDTNQRFSEADCLAWRRDGAVVIENFFAKDELAVAIADFERLYGRQGETDAAEFKHEGSFGGFHPKQFKNIDTLPYAGSVELNLLSLHPALLTLAQSLLGTSQVHLYQSHTWAKFTGNADYDQSFHCDFGNHTLLVPSDDVAMRTVNFVIYLSDVTDDLGAFHYVTKPDSDALLGPGSVFANDPETQQQLKSREHSGAAPLGSLLVYGIDVFHRGTNLTRPKGYRYTLTVSYKAAGNDMVGFHVWQTAANRQWDAIISHGTPQQLAALGVPLPGAAYWTSRTLSLCQMRWPEWDMRPYSDAARK